MLESILAALDLDRQTVIDLQKILVSIPALGPESGGQGERDKAEALKAFLRKLGFPEPTEMRAPDARVACGYRPSLAYVIPGVDRTRTFWILSHLDVVSPGDRGLWNTDPFELTVEGDMLFGRGVEDNHQGVVSATLLGKALVEKNAVPPINFGLLYVADEENGNQFGMEYIAEKHKDLFNKGDLFLVPDAGDADGQMIEIAEKSILWLKVTVSGKQCHASVPDEGINTLRAASDFIVRLRRLEEQFNQTNPLFQPPRSTFEPTKKEANVESVNIIPGRDVFYIDCRVLPGIDLQEVIEAIEKIGAEIVDDYGVSLSYAPAQRVQAPPPTSPDSDIVKRLIPAIRAVYGGDPKPVGIGGGTLAAIMRRDGFDAVVWAALVENAHQPNERSRISAHLGDAKVMARLLFG